MADSNTDEARLRAAEGQMRRALGLQHETALLTPQKGPAAGTNTMVAPQRRHFVRDGDVPVTMVRGEHGGALVQQLESTRRALRAQTTAFEEAVRALADSRNTIRDLQTKLAHASLAKDEAGSQADAEQQRIGKALAIAQQALADERAMRERAEDERDRAIAELRAAAQRQQVAAASGRVSSEPNPATATAEAGERPRRRGRPPKQTSSEIVEWWMPGWQEKYR